MENDIRPAEYYYLNNLLVADTGRMLTLAYQDLCLREVLKVENRSVRIYRHHSRTRVRRFLVQGPQWENHGQGSFAEDFLVRPFQKRESIQLSHLRGYLKKKLEDSPSALDRSIYKDLREKDLCRFRVFCTSKGRKVRKHWRNSISEVDSKFNHWFASDQELLLNKLSELGPMILLLDEDKLKQLEDIPEGLKNLHAISDVKNRFSILGDSLLFSATSFDFGSSFDADFGGGFDGFGGGEFGGGGAVGDW